MPNESNSYKQKAMEGQVERMFNLCQLVASVVHELNNSLTNVIGYSEVLLNTDCDEKTKRMLDIINAEALRCHRIAEDLLFFSKRREPIKEYIQINDIIESTLNLKKQQLRDDNIGLELYLSANLPGTIADPQRIQQVFINIINNAQQAMSGYTNQGKLLIETSLKDNRIIIGFSNNGPCIPKENLARIFDQFFTTKTSNKGTGLGLNISKSIIEEHGGNISVESKESEGVKFVISLPVTEEKQTMALGPKSMETKREEQANLKILVVDDDQKILNLFMELLGIFGHEVNTVENGNRAIKNLSKERYDLIICDIKMPEISGEELYNIIKAEDMELARRMIFITGDIINPETQNFLQNTGNSYISKPFMLEDVKNAIDKVVART